MENQKHSDGFKALTLALLATVAVMGNFGGERALRSASDGVYAHGDYAGEAYLVSRPGIAAEFYCNKKGGNVIRKETSPDETGEPETSYTNMGYPEACQDGIISEEDGKIWATKTNQLGILGLMTN